MSEETAVRIIADALGAGRKTLSEYESKQVLASYGIPVTREFLVENRIDMVKAADRMGYPLVVKGCSPEIAHKTEKGLVRVDVRSREEALEAYDAIMAGMNGAGGRVLVQEMVHGRRELVMGLTRDDQFGPCVMFGLGGIFTEILKDVSFRRAPLDRQDALDMMAEIEGRRILEPVRGMEPADKDKLADMLIRVGRLGLEIGTIREIDLNPVILLRGVPVAVDALIVLE
jgi:acetate---CoA ligase (ADP-forming) subunit beta